MECQRKHPSRRESVVALSTTAVLVASSALLSAATAGAASAQVAIVVPAVMVHTVTATTVSEFPVSLTSGVPVTFRTTEVAGTEDPVLHLFSGSRQVAVADGGGGGLAASLTHTPTTTGTYHLSVRSRTPASSGVATLLLNGQTWRSKVAFAGAQVTMSGLRSGEQLRTTMLPRGPVGPHRLYVLGADGVSAASRAVGFGSPGGALWTMPAARASAVVLVGSPPTMPAGPVRVTRNDVNLSGHDADGDGIGAELEARIGTCSAATESRGGFLCSRAADQADTDGDGINDGWEYFGTGTQTLPRWGANPRHKDLFAEVDFQMSCPNETPQRMAPAQAVKFADYYEDRIGNPTAAQQAAHAVTLRNPDGKPGIEVHLDTGVPPLTAADATTYGDWGGYTAVPRADPTSTECKGADYTQAWKTNMSTARRGIFRYLLGHARNGGQSAINNFAISGPLTDAVILAHESGHGMGLGHSGPDRATGDVDPNCKPNYQSLMNYAYSYQNRGFGDGTGGSPLNNAALTEAAAARPSDASYLDALEQVFGYWVDRTTGDVDWNRDGAIAPAGTTVRAYANYRPGGSCEFTRYNQSRVPNGETSRLAPALARLNQRAYAFYVDAGSKLRYSHSDSEWLCAAPSLTPCAPWSQPQTHALPAGRGVDAERIDSPESLMVVSVDSTGAIWHSRLTTDFFSKAETWTAPARIPGTSPALGEPSLASRGFCRMFLTYKTTGHELRHRRWTCAGGWEAEKRSLTDAGAPIVLPEYASPGTVGGYLPSRPGANTLIGAFADATGTLRLWRLDESLGRWVATGDIKAGMGAAQGRPAMAWVPTKVSTPTQGRLYLMWIARNTASPEARVVKMAMSYTKVTRDAAGLLVKVPQVGLKADLDNGWYYAFGIDLMFEPGYDTNLISLTSRATTDGPASIDARPKADGINDFRYTNYSDWATLRTQLCRNVVNPGGLGPNKVTCP